MTGERSAARQETNKLLGRVASDAQEKKQVLMADLQALALQVGPERLFTTLLIMMCMAPEGSATESTHGTVPVKIELLAYHLYPLLGHPPKSPLNPELVERALALVDGLITTDIQADSFHERDTSDTTASLNLSAFLGRLALDAKFVRGSAYPQQTMQEISEVQGVFEDWFTKRVGIGPQRAIELLLAILHAEEGLANEWRNKLRENNLATEEAWKEAKKTKKERLTPEQKVLLAAAHSRKEAQFLGYAKALSESPPDGVPVLREQVKLSKPPTIQEWDGLISLIGLTPESRNSIQDSVEMQRRPLYVFQDHRLLICDISNAADQLWQAFEDIARRDQPFYSGRYSKHRGEWLEDRIATLVRRVFPGGTIYQKLTYPDPDRGPNAIAELDMAIDWPPFLVVMEAKTAQFRFASQLGDVGRLRSDLKVNVADAFEQARRAVRYIQSVPQARFTESSGRTLVVQHEKIKRTYLTTVSLHHLAGIGTRLASIQELGLFGDGEFPWAISVADLDLVTQFCSGPDVFLHYVERRLALQKEPLNIHADEIDLFGAYLQTRLQPSRIWEREGMKRPDGIWLGGFQEPFDAVMSNRGGEHLDGPQIRLEIPREVEEILQELRKRENEKDARWIAFSILSLSDKALELVASTFRDLRSQSLNSETFRRIAYTEGDLAISVVGTKDQPATALLQNIQRRMLLEKYRRKCRRSIAFGVLVANSSKPFECAAWAEFEWQKDPEWDRLIDSEPTPTPIPGARIPGRNEPCLCGSSKKFKKCCLPKMEVARLG